MLDLVLEHDALLAEDLHGVDAPRVDLADGDHLAKVPLADHVQQLKVAQRERARGARRVCKGDEDVAVDALKVAALELEPDLIALLRLIAMRARRAHGTRAEKVL